MPELAADVSLGGNLRGFFGDKRGVQRSRAVVAEADVDQAPIGSRGQVGGGGAQQRRGAEFVYDLDRIALRPGRVRR